MQCLVRCLAISSIAFLLALSPTSAGTCIAGEIRFSQDVRPILAEHCIHCHGPDEEQRQAGLRPDMADPSSAYVYKADEPEDSEFLSRLTSADPDLQMPPADIEKRLTAEELALLRQWVAQGAKYEEHWAFRPIADPQPPETNVPVVSPVDRFIVAAQEKRGVRMQAPASRAQLIRRASFDLRGLPPTFAEVEAFVNDGSADAFANVVDQFLESPQYGQRWGRLWLDVARYADTHGGSAIGFTRFPFSYTYRDYVIRAFNADLPYDQFIREQLAADQLGLAENDPALAALGFLTVGMQFRSRHDVIDDQIDVVSRGLQGLTVACARCHDHKFDPITSRDYYSLYATLASSNSPDELPVIGTPEPSEELTTYQNQLAKRQAIYRDMSRDQVAVMRGRLRNQVGMYLQEIVKGLPEQDTSAAFLSYRTDDLRPIVYNRWLKYLAGLPKDDPVFRPWFRLRELDGEDFATQAQGLVKSLIEANGDPAQFANTASLSMEGPTWNPRVLAALEARQPADMLQVAEAYGVLFSEVHQEWLQALLSASQEAAPNGEVITDEDPRHAAINSSINQQLRYHLLGPDTPTAVSDEVGSRLLNRTVSDTLGGKRGTMHGLNLNAAGSPPRAMSLVEAEQAGPFYVFLRGNPLARGEAVSASFLTILSGENGDAFRPGRRRLDLAKAILAADNPLTRRVIVNWVWRNHFGVGLVRTPDDFGSRGTPPTHPALLDYLSSRFAEDGWSIKQLHRRIMLTDVYQQAAVEDTGCREEDPDNELLWRMPRRRLDMESMRDAMLFVSGELDTSTEGGRPFDLDSQPIVPRRSVYAFVNRDVISFLASTFDGADPTSCTVKRPDTTVPQQTLFVLNSDFIQDRAAAVARRAQEAADDDESRIRWLINRLYGRAPDEKELRLLLDYVESAVAIADDTQKEAAAASAWQQLAHALLAANEFHFVD